MWSRLSTKTASASHFSRMSCAPSTMTWCSPRSSSSRRRAALSITGRMHLAINSLSHGTPAITLATAGKVEGLAEMFGMPELCIEPRPGCAEQIIRTARTILDDEAGYRARIDEVLPEIRRRASLNYGG